MVCYEINFYKKECFKRTSYVEKLPYSVTVPSGTGMTGKTQILTTSNVYSGTYTTNTAHIQITNYKIVMDRPCDSVGVVLVSYDAKPSSYTGTGTLSFSTTITITVRAYVNYSAHHNAHTETGNIYIVPASVLPD